MLYFLNPFIFATNTFATEFNKNNPSAEILYDRGSNVSIIKSYFHSDRNKVLIMFDNPYDEYLLTKKKKLK